MTQTMIQEREIVVPPEGSNLAPLPAHEYEADDTCAFCHEPRTSETYEEYVAWWLANEYEGVQYAEDGGRIGYGPLQRDVYEYLRATCLVGEAEL